MEMRVNVSEGVEVVPLVVFDDTGGEAVRFQADGRVFWRGREVETDETFRAMMLAWHELLREWYRAHANGAAT
jgi:hypothetical protein